jgi:ketosteroid isomerase-like protein
MSTLPPSLRGPALAAAALAASTTAMAVTDAEIVAALDTEFQAAVARNDWRTMDRILHPDYVLVIGRGTVVDRATLLETERSKRRYEQQVEMPGTQTVRMFGPDTAVVTALLWLKGENLETHATFDYKLWFSDTYVRTKDGWKYAFGQAAQPLPAEPAKP